MVSNLAMTSAAKAMSLSEGVATAWFFALVFIFNSSSTAFVEMTCELLTGGIIE
jgi:hypothetical protein